MSIAAEIILTPLITLFVVQAIKLATDGIKGNFSLKNIFITYGGMPSSHTAIVCSLSAIVAYQEGLNSVSFGIALIFSLIVITDAMRLRRYIDAQGKAINKLIGRLPENEQKDFSLLATKIEHTLPQVLVGASIGVLIASLVHFF